MEERKKDHINLALQSRLELSELDTRFYYEPLLNAHPLLQEQPFKFLGKTFRYPIWVSSMTGGTKIARTINHNLARACNEFGLGMGLGSCRIILDDDTYFEDFNVRKIIGDDRALYANLGIAQIELAIKNNRISKITDLIYSLNADGLIVHVNPLQEWFQPEGDRLNNSPIETIKRLLDNVDFKIIVKEVGQGMGPQSLAALLQLPVAAIEFGAFGGTNFARVELMRDNESRLEMFEPLSRVGVDAGSMLSYINTFVEKKKQKKYPDLIISGGIRNFLDGYYLITKSKLPAIYGQASAFLKHAKEDYDQLCKFVENQINGLRIAQNYLQIRE